MLIFDYWVFFSEAVIYTCGSDRNYLMWLPAVWNCVRHFTSFILQTKWSSDVIYIEWCRWCYTHTHTLCHLLTCLPMTASLLTVTSVILFFPCFTIQRTLLLLLSSLLYLVTIFSIPHPVYLFIYPPAPPTTKPPSLNIVPLKHSCIVSSCNTARQKSVISHLSSEARKRR